MKVKLSGVPGTIMAELLWQCGHLISSQPLLRGSMRAASITSFRAGRLTQQQFRTVTLVFEREGGAVRVPMAAARDGWWELIAAAHTHDLMVLLDVVYNHFGPEGSE